MDDPLSFEHLAMLLLYRIWAPPCNQYNMPAVHPGVMTDLFEHELIDRDAKWQVVLTEKGQAALQDAVNALQRATQRRVLRSA